MTVCTFQQQQQQRQDYFCFGGLGLTKNNACFSYLFLTRLSF